MNTAEKKGNISAGIGDPYWYEWGIGLLKAVEMLNPDSGIEAVSFQKEGVKGWDDVVIRYSSGHQDYYQVKHSRPRSNLTFSDLVGKTEEQPSLLASLSIAWHEMGLCGTESSCILITNRQAGTQASRSRSKIYFPPLSKFINHISAEVKKSSTLEDISVPHDWQDAWGIWKSEMGPISDEEKLHFLRAITISTESPQLEDMTAKLATSLASLFSITVRQAAPLVNNLLSALLKWTTSLRGKDEWITGEDVMASLSESEPEIFGYCDVPTPVPFFPSREKAVGAITELLTSDKEHRIVFLEANPGAGKTSVVSRIVNQRAEDFSALIVDIRYYAYKPITPDAPSIPADADRAASPESLWYSLLSQIRERLTGRLLELNIPVRNHFLTADEARGHVLRLSAILAQVKHSPFVIVIDGIDHAARADRKGLPSLLGTIPAPETIPEGVRLLIAGQPASGYPEYPIWLRTSHDLVAPIALRQIEEQDIQLILSRSTTRISHDDLESAARIIHGVAKGNTLAAVFSVAESENCQTLGELEDRLSYRKLHSGVHAYYRTIWEVAIPESPRGIAAYLASVLCILQQRITGEIMHEAFPAWDKPAPEWDAILNSLEPLVVRDDDGYRVRHNDIRVFLESELRTDDAALQNVASLLADYYMGPSADPFFKQESIFTLLKISGRTTDMAHIFDPEWVIDAASFGRNLSTIYQEAEDAFLAISDVKDWEAALAVACGGLTLTKLSECLDAFPDVFENMSMPQAPLPQCLETERFIPPYSSWDKHTILQVMRDIRMLVERNEINRAQGLMEHWLSDVTPAAIVSSVSGITDDSGLGGARNLTTGIGSVFEDWGALAFRLDITTEREQPKEHVERVASYLFEKGWITECLDAMDSDRAYLAIKTFQPMFLTTIEVAIEKASKKSMWGLVGKLLNRILDKRSKLQLSFQIKSAYWALMALGEDAAKDWLKVISEVRTGKSNDITIDIPLMLDVARVIGWLEPHRDASAIASELTTAISHHGRHVQDLNSLQLPFQAAAMVGLLERMFEKGNLKSAATLVQPEAIRIVIELIWKNSNSIDFHEVHHQALSLTFKLFKMCQEIGNVHYEMVLSFSLSEAAKFPVNQKLPILWEVLRRSGHKDLLRKWAEHWIGEHGAAWSEVGYSERAEIVAELSSLASKEGWHELVAQAEARQRHRIIGYSSHKDYSFQEPLEWLEELSDSDPSTWREEGLQLLEICRACDDQGGDNRLSSSIEEVVATAAFRCGPDGALSFFNFVDTERYWLHTVRSNIIAASKNVISDGTVAGQSDILTLWACAVGITRCFNRNQAQTLTALRDSILVAIPSEDKEKFVNRMKWLTPGEFHREEYDKDRDRNEPTKGNRKLENSDIELCDAISDLSVKVDHGYEPNWMEIGALALRVVGDSPTNRTELISRLFELVDANRRHISGWGYWGEEHPLRELISTLREDEIWMLMQSAVRPVGDEYWSRSVSHNVHLICLFHAASEGIEHLKKGAQSMFAMHHLWAGILDEQNSYKLGCCVTEDVETWQDFAIHVLRYMLASVSSETVSIALRGLGVVIDIAPNMLVPIFTNSNEKILSKLLLGAEVWVCRHKKEMNAIIDTLWERRDELSMSDRIQLWICKLNQAHANGEVNLPETFMPIIVDNNARQNSSTILTKPRMILEIDAKVEGIARLANTYSAARNFISRFGRITGRDTEHLESEIAEGLDMRKIEPKIEKTSESKRDFATEDGDMVMSSDDKSILDNALEHELRKFGWTDADAGDIAIAVTHGDDPWILQKSPLPYPSSFSWPEGSEVDEWLLNKKDTKDVRNRLRLLARGDDLKEGEIVLGCNLRLFTTHHDCEMRYWIEHVNSGDIEAKPVPVSPCGRCFQFFLPDRFEPYLADRLPLALFSRSSTFFSFSTLEVVPAKVLQDEFGWKPKIDNPLEWERDGRVVARYEMYHGPLDYNWSRRHMRQSTLSRWVVNAEELSLLRNLSPQWDFEVNHFVQK